ncbi:MAG: HAMP domain-containing sensor histidine kinase, partial [Rhodoferax sp.]
LDYARPDHVDLKPVRLMDVVEACTYPVKDQDDMRIKVDVSPDLRVMADEVELTRVISNLLENARRYGKSPDTGITAIDIAARARDPWLLIKVRDHGAGVAPDVLPSMTKPFFRGDAARTEATGAGLGLSIVDKTIQRMGGSFTLTNASTGGLAAHIRLHIAPATQVSEKKQGNLAVDVHI